MSGGKRNGHLIAGLRNKGNTTWYLAPGLDGANEFGASLIVGNSVAPAGTRLRIIAALVNTSGVLTLTDAAGQFIIDLTHNAVAESYTFGPLGIQLENGCILEISGSAGTTDIFVVYELD